ncbi:MAG: SgcJ/EcaC family oxidoreductase [Elusimicrobia bacterium]|nr:SgcJ/EcaC family oxidoreductase [Elusimicrobiota bacterium]
MLGVLVGSSALIGLLMIQAQAVDHSADRMESSSSVSDLVLAAQALPSGRSPQNADETAIRGIIAAWYQGWERNRTQRGREPENAAAIAQDYAVDADRINAFGARLKGREAIEDFLTRLFQEPGTQSMERTPMRLEIRFVRPDAAVVLTYDESTGQRRQDDTDLGPRKTHCLRVLSRASGRWEIVTHMTMDEKEW